MRFCKMLILDNFVHADLHPGNMMVRFYKNELYRHKGVQDSEKLLMRRRQTK